MIAPADSAINLGEVRVMTTSETHQRAPAGYPLPLKTETGREKFTSSTLMSKPATRGSERRRSRPPDH
jgi:hypothetical protein